MAASASSLYLYTTKAKQGGFFATQTSISGPYLSKCFSISLLEGSKPMSATCTLYPSGLALRLLSLPLGLRYLLPRLLDRERDRDLDLPIAMSILSSTYLNSLRKKNQIVIPSLSKKPLSYYYYGGSCITILSRLFILHIIKGFR